nr:MAG: hypothetical protein [Bacteriophage sp.]
MMGKYIQFVCSGVSNEHRYFVAEIFKYYSGSLAHSSVNIREVWAIVRETLPKFAAIFRNKPSFFSKHSGIMWQTSGNIREV